MPRKRKEWRTDCAYLAGMAGKGLFYLGIKDIGYPQARTCLRAVICYDLVMQKKKIDPAISEHFRKMQERSWKVRQQKILDKAKKVETQNK